jgi:hypothetical protein
MHYDKYLKKKKKKKKGLQNILTNFLVSGVYNKNVIFNVLLMIM